MSEPICIEDEVKSILGKIPIPNLFDDCHLIEIDCDEVIIHRRARNLEGEMFLTPDEEDIQDYIPIRQPLRWKWQGEGDPQ